MKTTNYDNYFECLCYYLRDSNVLDEDKKRFPDLDWEKIEKALDELPERVEMYTPTVEKYCSNFKLEECTETTRIYDLDVPFIRMRVNVKNSNISYEEGSKATYRNIFEVKVPALRKKLLYSKFEEEEYTVDCVLEFTAVKTWKIDTYYVFYENGEHAYVEVKTLEKDSWLD